ncbi:Actin- protein 6 [Coemansia sp. RSA 1813]|nr:Actin- protein 6 [Coemansia sp. RSA 1843]KAJ2093271.1 Actin- protein 6 [Coemansia sp. RSA 986]KAJ2573524.1 Actin- protein 6 [Coemansia sp. RSA 1813]
MRTLVLDNGSYTIKCGYAEDSNANQPQQQPQVIPNTVTRTKRTRRVCVADLAEASAADLSGLYYRSPFERGYLVHWDAELVIWDRVLSDDVLGCAPRETHLMLTEPVLNFRQIQRSMDEVVFEEYGFASAVRTPATRLAVEAAGKASECTVIVDVGHAFTYVVPYWGGRQVVQGIRRVDIGGRMLTNYLKETVSFRYWDMMDETYIMSAVKEQTCFVSQDFDRDQEAAAAVRVDYVLPDFVHSKRGFVRGCGDRAEQLMAGSEAQQVLPLARERFAVPEALFHPSDVGMDHMGGIHNAVVQAVGACPPETRAVMLANIVLVGGSAQLPGLRDRLQAEVQALSPDIARVHVTVPDDPTICAWQGGRLLAAQHENNTVDSWRISKQEFHEIGPDRTIAHFNGLI